MLSPNITASDVNKGEPWLYCHSYTDRLRRKTKGQHHVIFFSHKTFELKNESVPLVQTDSPVFSATTASAVTNTVIFIQMNTAVITWLTLPVILTNRPRPLPSPQMTWRQRVFLVQTTWLEGRSDLEYFAVTISVSPDWFLWFDFIKVHGFHFTVEPLKNLKGSNGSLADTNTESRQNSF